MFASIIKIDLSVFDYIQHAADIIGRWFFFRTEKNIKHDKVYMPNLNSFSSMPARGEFCGLRSGLRVSKMLDCGILAIFFSDQAPILTRCETVPHPKFVKEMLETSVYPLNVVNTPVLNDFHHCLQLIKSYFPWQIILCLAVKWGPVCTG